MRKLKLVLMAGVMSVLMTSGAAFAQTNHEPVPKTSKKKPLVIDGGVVKGYRHAPQAFYVLPRSRLGFETMTLKKDFVPKIIRSVDQTTF